MTQLIKYIGIWCLLGPMLMSCESFLDERPSKSIVVPNTVGDLRSILNAADRMNTGGGYSLVLSDDIFTTDEGWLGYNEASRNGYIWNQSWSSANGDFASWTLAYSRIFSANLVLEEAENIRPSDQQEATDLSEVMATALFYRAFHYHELMQLFSHPIVQEADLDREAIPLKLTPAVDEQKEKATARQVYGQMISDLNEALKVLPESEVNVLGPSKLACYALLARIYLDLNDYHQALENAEKGLMIKSALLDFNAISKLVNIPVQLYTYPFPRFNGEVIMHLQAGTNYYQFSPMTYIDTALYNSYEEMDLRKYLYFTAPDEGGRVNFVGNFTGDFQVFTGLTTGELYLIKAESQARLNLQDEAINTLNSFLPSRYMEGTYIPHELKDNPTVLNVILQERRKELVYRGAGRWSDMRRFLRDEEMSFTRVRVIEGVEYQLSVDPLEFIVDIPRNERELNDKLL